VAKLIAELLAQREREDESVVLVEKQLGEMRLVGLKRDAGESLNAGLDEEDQDEEAYVPPPFESLEAPDLSLYADKTQAMEALAMDLIYLAEDIERAGGMNKNFALEAQRLLPEEFSVVPMGYYTTTATATRLKTSMEALSKGIWAAIIAGAAAVIAAIVAFYRWMAGEKKAPEGDKAEAKDVAPAQAKAVKALDEMVELSEKMPQILIKAGTAIHNGRGVLQRANIVLTNDKGEEKHCASFQDVIDHMFSDKERYGRAKEFLEKPEAIFYDITTHGPYSKVVTNVGHNIRFINQALQLKLNGLDEVVRRDLNSNSSMDQFKNSLALKELNHPIEIPFEGKPKRLQELAQLIYNERGDVVDHPTTKPIVFDQMFDQITKVYTDARVNLMLKDMKHCLKTLGDMEQRIEKLQGVARDLNSDGIPGALSQDIGTFVRQTLLSTMSDLQGFAMLCHQLRNYLQHLEYAARETIAFGREIVRKVVLQLRKEGREVPQAWEQVLDDLNRQLAAISKAYFSFR
jgi:hypothetical protein